MKIFKTPWKDDFLELVCQSKQSIKITSPYIKKEICDEMLKVKRSSSKIDLITSCKLMSFYTGSLDISAIENIIDSNGSVKNYPKLHSKIYLFDDEKAIITSGNMTVGGMLKNYEYGIFIDEKSIIENIVLDFSVISKNEATGIVKKSDLITIRSILKKIQKPILPTLPEFETETPEETFDIIEGSLEQIQSSLKGWKLDVFLCANSIITQTFTLSQINQFESHLKSLHPNNEHIPDKIRQQLQYLRDIGLIEFLGNGKYKKLWK